MANPLKDAENIIERWAKAKRIDVSDAIRASALDLQGRVIEQTPYKTGRLRGGWQLEGDINADQSVNKMTLLNNVEYAEAVEYGLGKGDRTPALMLNQSVLEWVRDIEADIKRQVE